MKSKTINEISNEHKNKKIFIFVDGKHVNKDDFLDFVPTSFEIREDKIDFYILTESHI